MDFSDYIFRSHYQGELVSVPKPLTNKQKETLYAFRSKEKLTDNQKKDWHSLENKLNESEVYKLGETAKSLLHTIVWNEKYGIETKVKSKYFTKGIECEKKARDMLSVLSGKILVADKTYKSNKWVKGQRDIADDDCIIDIKTSYSYNSFIKHLNEKNHEYYKRQMDNYMELWNIPQSIISYVLVDTPYKLISDEIRRLDWDENVLTINGDVRENKIIEVVELVKQHIYTEKGLDEFLDYINDKITIRKEWFADFVEIPANDRIHLVEHEYDKTRIEQRNECLNLCREYMNKIKTNTQIKLNKWEQTTFQQGTTITTT